MIRFNELLKACSEINFTLEKRTLEMVVVDDKDNEVLCLSILDVWDFIFYREFNWLSEEYKATLINAMARDYERFLNGDD